MTGCIPTRQLDSSFLIMFSGVGTEFTWLAQLSFFTTQNQRLVNKLLVLFHFRKYFVLISDFFQLFHDSTS
jgi:hypothetical protein